MIPCELLAVTTVMGNSVAKSLAPKKLTTKARVAIKVSPCRNGPPRSSRDMLSNRSHTYFPIAGLRRASAITCVGALGKDVFRWPRIIACQPVSRLDLDQWGLLLAADIYPSGTSRVEPAA